MTHAIIRPSFTRQDARGTLRELLNEGVWQSVVQGEMVAGAVMGNHYHRETRVFFFLVGGRARVVIEHINGGAQEDFEIGAFEGVIFQPDYSHAVIFLADSSYFMLKSLPYDPQNPDTYEHSVYTP